MGDAGDDHQALNVADGIHDPVFADSNPIVVPTGEFDASRWPWIVGQLVDCVRDSVAQRAVESSVRTCRRRV